MRVKCVREPEKVGNQISAIRLRERRQQHRQTETYKRLAGSWQFLAHRLQQSMNVPDYCEDVLHLHVPQPHLEI